MEVGRSELQAHRSTMEVGLTGTSTILLLENGISLTSYFLIGINYTTDGESATNLNGMCGQGHFEMPFFLQDRFRMALGTIIAVVLMEVPIESINCSHAVRGEGDELEDNITTRVSIPKRYKAVPETICIKGVSLVPILAI